MTAFSRPAHVLSRLLPLLVLALALLFPTTYTSAQPPPPIGETCTMTLESWEVLQVDPTGPFLSLDEECDDDIQIDPGDDQPTFIGESLPEAYHRVTYTLWINDEELTMSAQDAIIVFGLFDVDGETLLEIGLDGRSRLSVHLGNEAQDIGRLNSLGSSLQVEWQRDRNTPTTDGHVRVRHDGNLVFESSTPQPTSHPQEVHFGVLGFLDSTASGHFKFRPLGVEKIWERETPEVVHGQ